ncbi:hypothetical protein Hanom_Chr06g00485641 [Helianthus anomalus]
MTRLSLTVSERIHTKPLSPSFMPSTLIPMTIRKTINTKTMHFVRKILAGILVPISASSCITNIYDISILTQSLNLKLKNSPEMIVAKPVFDTAFEFASILTTIFTSMNTIPMTLPLKPFTSIHIPSVKLINTITTPQPLPILPPISATFRPRLNAIPVILLVNPITLIPPIQIIVIHPTSRTLPFIKLTLINIPIAVHLHQEPRIYAFVQSGL